MSYFHDAEFQKNIVAFLCKDRNFLKRTSGLLEPEDFKPRRGDSQELHILATMALEFWRQYGEPLGGMLRTETLDLCREKRFGNKLKEKLLDQVEDIRRNHGLVAVEALEQKIISYKARRAKSTAIQEMIRLQEKGELTDEKFLQITQDVQKAFGRSYKVTDYLKGLEKRIRRRQLESQRKFPYLMIEELDRSVRAIPRGSLAMLLAKWKVGKSLALAHIAYAHLIQAYNVLFFTLEDPQSEVEDRLDGLISGSLVRSLDKMPNKLRRRFKNALAKLNGRIKIIDATEGGMSVQRMEDIWENQRNRGFVADCVIVDYDDEIVPSVRHKGESARRQEFADIYRELRRFAARKSIYLWTAAQAKRGKDSQMIVKGEDAAEDISKMRKVALCIGIGSGPKAWQKSDTEDNSRHLHIAGHKFDKSKVGWSIMGDFKRGIFYDAEATREMAKRHSPKSKVDEEVS